LFSDPVFFAIFFSEVRSPEDLKTKEEKRKQERQKDFMDALLAPFEGMKH